jgi:hypothetical protein
MENSVWAIAASIHKGGIKDKEALGPAASVIIHGPLPWVAAGFQIRQAPRISLVQDAYEIRFTSDEIRDQV